MRAKFWSENLNGRDNSEELDIDVKKKVEWILEKCDGNVWTAFIWFRIGTNDGLL
jgi:hypothetical protein